MSCTKKHQVHWFYDTCWRENFYVLCPATQEEVADFLKTQFSMNYHDTVPVGGLCISIDNKQGVHQATVIVISEWKMSPQCLGILAHECFHAAESTLNNCGVRHCNKSSEAFAYLIESIFRRSLELILKPSKKK